MRNQLGLCPICLHEVIELKQEGKKEKLVKLRCGHLFHKECIDQWLKIKDYCPYRCFGTE